MSPLPMTTASRSSGVAPLSAYFDAVGASSGVIQPQGSPPDYAAFHYRWSFGDANSGAWAHSGKSKNVATGYGAAHVFEQHGSYPVTLQAMDDLGRLYEYQQSVLVADPEVVYAGRTLFVSDSTGNDAHTGTSISTPFKSMQKALGVLFASNGPRRVLFRRGESWTTSGYSAPSGRAGPFHIGAYGSGPNPVIRLVGAADYASAISWPSSTTDVRVVDVDTSYSGAAHQSFGVTPGAMALLLRSKFSDFRYGVIFDDPGCNDITVQDCQFIGIKHSGVMAAGGSGLSRHFAYMGNSNPGHPMTAVPPVVPWAIRTYCSRSLYQHSLFRTNSGNGPIRLNGRQAGVAFVIVSDDVFDCASEDGAVRCTLEEASDRLNNVIIESNLFKINGQQKPIQRFVKIHVSDVTIRNNLFDLTGSTGQLGGSGSPISYEKSPVAGTQIPSGLRVEHNTAYRGDAQGTFTLIASQSGLPAPRAHNNIVYAPGAEFVGVCGGPVDSKGNLLVDPRFVNAATGDFQPGVGSPARGICVPSTVRLDMLDRVRPLRVPRRHAGALEAG